MRSGALGRGANPRAPERGQLGSGAAPAGGVTAVTGTAAENATAPGSVGNYRKEMPAA